MDYSKTTTNFIFNKFGLSVNLLKIAIVLLFEMVLSVTQAFL